jgi:hypothetical protein
MEDYGQRLENNLIKAIQRSGKINAATVIDTLGLLQALMYMRYAADSDPDRRKSFAQSLSDKFVRNVEGLLSAEAEDAGERH